MNTADLTAQILTLAADRLDEHATITHPVGGYQIPRCMTEGHRGLVICDIHSAIDRVYGATTRNSLRATIPAMLPPATGTVAEYAERLRTLAA